MTEEKLNEKGKKRQNKVFQTYATRGKSQTKSILTTKYDDTAAPKSSCSLCDQCRDKSDDFKYVRLSVCHVYTVNLRNGDRNNGDVIDPPLISTPFYVGYIDFNFSSHVTLKKNMGFVLCNLWIDLKRERHLVWFKLLSSFLFTFTSHFPFISNVSTWSASSVSKQICNRYVSSASIIIKQKILITEYNQIKTMRSILKITAQ